MHQSDAPNFSLQSFKVLDVRIIRITNSWVAQSGNMNKPTKERIESNYMHLVSTLVEIDRMTTTK
jgi:hypothetical protein